MPGARSEHDPVDGALEQDLASPEYSSLAVASTLSTLGYGLFAWLQPGDLDSIRSMQDLSHDAHAEAALAAAEVAPAAPDLDVDPDLDALADLEEDLGLGSGPSWPGRSAVPDTLFDEDLAAAQLLASLNTNGSDPADAPAANAQPASEEALASYSTPRNTIAMLEEIAFLDE